MMRIKPLGSINTKTKAIPTIHPKDPEEFEKIYKKLKDGDIKYF